MFPDCYFYFLFNFSFSKMLNFAFFMRLSRLFSTSNLWISSGVNVISTIWFSVQNEPENYGVKGRSLFKLRRYEGTKSVKS